MTTSSTTAAPTEQRTPIHATHPSFCEGGISWEKSVTGPVGDWLHEGRETTWHAGQSRLNLKLIRHDGYSKGTYHRGAPEVEFTVTDTACLDEAGNEITVVVELGHGRLNLLLDFLRSISAKP